MIPLDVRRWDAEHLSPPDVTVRHFYYLQGGFVKEVTGASLFTDSCNPDPILKHLLEAGRCISSFLLGGISADPHPIPCLACHGPILDKSIIAGCGQPLDLVVCFCRSHP